MSDELGLAWQRTEAALPNSERDDGRPGWQKGPWRLTLNGPWPMRDGPKYRATAEPYNDFEEVEGIGSSPTAALIDLAEKMEARNA